MILYGRDGVRYTYCHGSERIVANGAEVRAGEELGLTGNTGTETTGPHLHFQINFNARRCPQALLLDIYKRIKPPPTAHTVKTLPASGCTYKSR